jgi:hypothetical protein
MNLSYGIKSEIEFIHGQIEETIADLEAGEAIPKSEIALIIPRKPMS